MPVVLRRGQAVGTWRLKSLKDSIKIEADGFDGATLPDLRNEVTDIGRFLGRQAARVKPSR
jgi:hypothetical protein